MPLDGQTSSDATPPAATQIPPPAAPPSETQVSAADTRPLEIGSYDRADAETWFARAEALFQLRNIKSDAKKSALLIQALPTDLFKILGTDISTTTPSYDALKGTLLELHGTSTATRAKKIFSYINTPAGDQSPSMLYKTLQHWMTIPRTRSREAGNLNLIMEIVIQCFPPQARCLFPNYRDMTVEEFLQAADNVALQISQQQEFAAALNALNAQNTLNAHPVEAEPIPSPDTTAAPIIPKSRAPWCYYHDRFGPRARNCIKPCSFVQRPQYQPPRPPAPQSLRQQRRFQ